MFFSMNTLGVRILFRAYKTAFHTREWLFNPKLVGLHHNCHQLVIWVCAMSRKSRNSVKSQNLWLKLIIFNSSVKLQAGCLALSAFQIHHRRGYDSLQVIFGIEWTRIEWTRTDLTSFREESLSTFCHHVVSDQYSAFGTTIPRSGKEVQDELLLT